MVNQVTNCLESILGELECPVSLEPLATAVTLTPCSHKLNESVAQKYFGGMREGSVVNPQPCPFCNGRVTAYFPDHTTRSVVAKVLEALSNQKVFEHQQEIALADRAVQKVKERNFAGGLAIAETIPGETNRSFAQSCIAAAMADLGYFLEAREVAETLVDESNKSRALSYTCMKMSKSLMFSEAHKLAQTITIERDKAVSLSYISQDMAQAGKFDEALEVANSITDEEPRSWALRTIAETMARAGNLKRACEITEAVDPRFIHERGGAFFAISEAMADNRNWEDALRYAEKIDEAASAAKLPAFLYVIRKMSDAGLVDMAREVADRTLYGRYKSIALEYIAEHSS